MGGKIMTDVKAVLQFLFAGNATFTLRSGQTGTRYTYKVSEADKKNPNDPNEKTVHFVGLLTGPDNVNSYTYLGLVKDGFFRLTKASKMAMGSGPVKAFTWALQQFQMGVMPAKLEFWHEGRCGRCGRVLTVPESIESGYGPECIHLLGGTGRLFPAA